jgi:hypothetical protein
LYRLHKEFVEKGDPNYDPDNLGSLNHSMKNSMQRLHVNPSRLSANHSPTMQSIEKDSLDMGANQHSTQQDDEVIIGPDY